MQSTRRFFVLRNTIRCFSNQSNVIGSIVKDVEIPKVSLHEYIRNKMEKYLERTAVECFETKKIYTYADILQKSLALTNFLQTSLNLHQNDTVCIVVRNSPEYPIIFLGAAQAGLRISTCNPTYTPHEIQRQLTDSNSVVVFTSTDLLPTVRQAVFDSKNPIKIIEISKSNSFGQDTISFEQTVSGDRSLRLADVKSSDTLGLPYSSGTTGLPKGVELSNYNLVANLSQIVEQSFCLVPKRDDSEQDIVPAFLPFFHIYGQVLIMLNTLQVGHKLVTIPQFTLNNFIDVLKNYKPTVFYGVPLMVNCASNSEYIKPEDLSSIRTFMSGAAALGASDVERFLRKTNNKTNMVQGYGMTETSPVTLQQTPYAQNGVKLGGSGFVFPNTHAKIVAIDGDSTEGVGPNQTGELLIKGPQVMKGYYNNPKANKEIFTEDGWLRTGDIAHYDKDNHFYITDRLKELIKVKGFQVAPAELEEILRSHPAVEDAAVVGVAHENLDESPKAFLVLKKDSNVKSEQIQEFVASKVAKYKQLTGGVVFVDTIPKNASGKILRKVLKTM